jgi:uncharacterized membrane protein
MLSLKLHYLPPLERLSTAIFGFVFLFAGIGHFVVMIGIEGVIGPNTILLYLPPWLPFPEFLVWATGPTEILGGLALFTHKYRKAAAWFLLVHLMAFLSIHGWHVWVGGNLGEQIAPIPVWVTWARLSFQFVMIGLMWRIATIPRSL